MCWVKVSKKKILYVWKKLHRLQLASRIVYKEMFLTHDELANVSNEASALIDFIVLRASTAAVGIGVSTFSFYLQEDRIISGHDPRSTVLLMLPQIGTDELFYTAALVATKTRQDPHVKSRLVDNCRRRDGLPCASKAPMGKYLERHELVSRRLWVYIEFVFNQRVYFDPVHAVFIYLYVLFIKLPHGHWRLQTRLENSSYR